jgi:hypothetical protein
MGMFAEPAIVDYRLSFADQGKQTFDFRFPFAANKRKFRLVPLANTSRGDV